MTETKQEKERVIIVGVEHEGNYQYFEESMLELKNLTKTAEGEVVFSLTQKRPQIDRRTVIGKGKIAELVTLIETYEANLDL